MSFAEGQRVFFGHKHAMRDATMHNFFSESHINLSQLIAKAGLS